jgi:hypothetical protein
MGFEILSLATVGMLYSYVWQYIKEKPFSCFVGRERKETALYTVTTPK